MKFPPDGHPYDAPPYAMRRTDVNYAWYRFVMCTLWTTIGYGTLQGLVRAFLGVPL